ncbi:MAG TPA: carbohydrate ABC transporter permease [Chloroflexota bacterium]|nr:carbohydrate ABC transporter permease [Chloroflexota bacterium]
MSAIARAAPRSAGVVRLRRAVGYALLYAFLLLFSVFMLLPFLFALSGSLKPEPDVFAVPIQWIPSDPQWQNYVLPFRKNFGRYFLNSAIVSLVLTFSPLLLCSLAGYSLAKFQYPGRNLIFLFILSTIMLPAQVTLVPAFLIVKELGWVNTYAGLIVPGLATTFGTFLMRQFFLAIPGEYVDAARIDGASEPRIYWSIMLPMCRPALSALAIFSFTGSWNSFLWPLVIVNQDEMRTVPLGIVFYIGEQRVPEYGQLLAVAVIATLPVLALFLAMQREFIRGAAISGLKG